MERENQINSQAEETLWNRFLAGDTEAFSLLYTTYVQEMFIYGSSIVTDRELVKDCIQEVFIKLYKKRSALKEVHNVSHYLCVALKHTLYNYYRQTATFTELSEVETIPSGNGNGEEELIAKEIRLERCSFVKQFFQLLSPRQQKAVYHRFVEDLSYQEIGQLMDMNFQSAQNLVQRSLRKIRAVLFFFTFLLFFF